MIYLFTGSNGTGKTNTSIKFICEDLDTEGIRPVFYYEADRQPLGIKEAGKLDWQKITLEEAQNWQQFPEGSIFLLDEFRHIWPFRPHTKPVPGSVDALAEHRGGHGMDFVLTAQKPAAQFDPAIQGFIEEHIHLSTKSGSKNVQKLTFQAFCSNPYSPPQLMDYEKQTIKLDKKYFEYYQSAKVHTHIDRLPYRKLWWMALLVVFIVGVFFYLNEHFLKAGGQSAEPGEMEESGLSAEGFNPLNKSREPVTDEEYYALRKARIPHFPHTAPLYDGQTKPVSYPRISCAEIITPTRTVCRCNTQQFTRVIVEPEVCHSIASSGWFDPAKARNNSYQGNSVQENSSSNQESFFEGS